MLSLPSRRSLLVGLILLLVGKFWPWEQWLVRAAMPRPVAEMPADPVAREAALRDAAKRLDVLGPVFARGRRDVYVALAEIERGRGWRASEARLRLSALRAGPASLDERLAAVTALLALRTGEAGKLAGAMLEDAERFAAPHEAFALAETRRTLSLPAPRRSESASPLVTRAEGRVLVLALGRLDAGLPEHVARVVERELGAAVEVVDAADYLPLAAYRMQGLVPQYRDADMLAEIEKLYWKERAEKPTLATLAIIDHDLYGLGMNFLWASARDGLSVISAARLADDDPSVTRARVAKQALTSVLDGLGAPRALHSACVNANVLSVAEFDAKSDLVCAETRLFLGHGRRGAGWEARLGEGAPNRSRASPSAPR